MTDALMPAAFLGHGSPLNALDQNGSTAAWRGFGGSVPRPTHPKPTHDFYGSPDALFAVHYPAPGDPAVAAEIAELARPTWIALDQDSWGIDHGTWSVLVHAFPDDDIPVLQLSINAEKSFDYHFELGAKLAPLRARGILILGSGNVVHNLGRVDWNRPEEGFDWARRFDEAAKGCMTSAPG